MGYFLRALIFSITLINLQLTHKAQAEVAWLHADVIAPGSCRELFLGRAEEFYAALASEYHLNNVTNRFPLMPPCDESLPVRFEALFEGTRSDLDRLKAARNLQFQGNFVSVGFLVSIADSISVRYALAVPAMAPIIGALERPVRSVIAEKANYYVPLCDGGKRALLNELARSSKGPEVLSSLSKAGKTFQSLEIFAIQMMLRLEFKGEPTAWYEAEDRYCAWGSASQSLNSAIN